MSEQQHRALAQILRSSSLDFANTPLPDLRTRFAQMMSMLPDPADVDVVSSQLGGIPVTELAPKAGARSPSVVLYFHGGA